MTASIGPTMTASFGSTEAIADGLKWPRFKQAAKRKISSWAGPVQAVMDFPQRGVGPTQGVRVGPCGSVLTTCERRRFRSAGRGSGMSDVFDTHACRRDRRRLLQRDGLPVAPMC